MFKMDSRGGLEWFLGMRILEIEGKNLDQEKHIRNILEQFNIEDCKQTETPAKNLWLKGAQGIQLF